MAARARQRRALLIGLGPGELRLVVAQPFVLGRAAAARLRPGFPAAQVTATASGSASSGRAGRAIIALIGSHGANTEEYDHEDHEHDHYQAGNEEKHSTTKHARAVWLAPARHTRPRTRAFPCIASTLDTSRLVTQ